MTGTGTTREHQARFVGVDLQDSEDTRAIVDALEADNRDLTIRRIPGLVKVTSPTDLVIRQQSVEERLGRPWETGEFQLSIVSYVGNIVKWEDDEIVIRWEH